MAATNEAPTNLAASGGRCAGLVGERDRLVFEADLYLADTRKAAKINLGKPRAWNELDALSDGWRLSRPDDG